MNKFIDFTPETAGEEHAMLVGRLEAFAAYVVQEEYSISREMCAACWDLNCRKNRPKKTNRMMEK